MTFFAFFFYLTVLTSSFIFPIEPTIPIYGNVRYSKATGTFDCSETSCDNNGISGAVPTAWNSDTQTLYYQQLGIANQYGQPACILSDDSQPSNNKTSDLPAYYHGSNGSPTQANVLYALGELCYDIAHLISNHKQSKKIVNDSIHTLHHYSVHEFERCFVPSVYRQREGNFNVNGIPRKRNAQIFSLLGLYQFKGFRDLLKRFDTCLANVGFIKNKFDKDKRWAKAIRKRLPGYTNRDFKTVIYDFYDELVREHEAAIKRQINTNRIRQEELVRSTFESQKHTLQDLKDEWAEIDEIYRDDDFVAENRFERRIQALQSMEHDGYLYDSKAYLISPAATTLLHSIGSDPNSYSTCYGNQLQHVIHQECIDGIEHLSILSADSIVYPYKNHIAECIDATREYNQAGLIEQATTVSDFCWSFLDYGKAIAEGAVEGAIGAVNDIIEHPGQALLCAVAGEYVLAYQLSKVVYNVAGIGITYLIDSERGQQQWDDYVAPVTELINAINNQEITLRDTIKGATHLAVGWKAQEKLLGGLGKICKTAKTKALKFAKNNPLTAPEKYLVIPEGIVLKATQSAYEIEIEGAKSLCEKLDKITNPAHSINQYEYLNFDLRAKQYTSIAPCTKHGLERLIQRFTPEEVQCTIKNPDLIKIQNDGAKAFIKKIGEKYSIITVNPKTERIITGINGLDAEAAMKLGQHYGWNLT